METATVSPGQAMEGLAFGTEAERRLATLDLPATPGARLIVADSTRPAEALTAAVDLKMRGERCVLALCLPEPRLVRARLAAAAVVAQVAEDDHRRALFDQIAAGTLRDASGKLLSEIPVYPDAVIRTLIALIRLADELIVGSWTEYERISRLLSYRHPEPLVVPGYGATLFTVESEPRNEVVVWGPYSSARELTIFAYALADLHAPWTIVCRDFTDALLPATYVSELDGRTALARASVVMDVETHNPGPALALAKRGVRLVVEASSGVHEHVRNTIVFEGADRRSIIESARVALGSSVANCATHNVAAIAPLRVKSFEPEPLVTIVIPTRPARRALFDAALASVLVQSHKNLDVVVFELQSDEVFRAPLSSDPRVRLERQRDRRGINDVAAGACSKYFGILYDDDLLFPRHIESLVAALETSGAGVAWADLLVRYLERCGDSEWLVGGYGLWNGIHQPFDRVSILGQCTLGNMVPCLMNRAAFLRTGGFDYEFSMFADWDLCIRLMQAGEFVYVPRITCQYSRFLDNSNKGTQDWHMAGDDTLKIFQKHPSSDRFTVAERRNAVLQYHMTASRPPDVPPLPHASANAGLEA